MTEHDEEALVDYLINAGEAVEYGERWTETTTHEWWRDSTGERHARLVMTYHGGGNRGDDDEAEYVRRLLDMGRAVELADGQVAHMTDEAKAELREIVTDDVTHVIWNGTPVRIRYYAPPPEVS